MTDDVTQGLPRMAGPGSPVFVLSTPCSGAALMRILLDSHPMLACPPNANLPAILWPLFPAERLPSLSPGEGPELDIPEEVITAAVRDTAEESMVACLAGQRKERFCDTSPETARLAFLLLKIWPDAKFVLWYRHPMATIDSAMRQLNDRYMSGFEDPALVAAANSVQAQAPVWLENTGAMMNFQRQYPERCRAVRREDWLMDMQAAADSVYSFLEVAPVPDIARAVFGRDARSEWLWRHRSPRVATDSPNGWTLRADLIDEQTRRGIIGLCGPLGYLAPDGNWGLGDLPADLRVGPMKMPLAGGLW